MVLFFYTKPSTDPSSVEARGDGTGAVRAMQGLERIVVGWAVLFIAMSAAAQGPEVSNVAASLAAGVATVTYDIANGPADIALLLSQDGGETFPTEATTATGDVGPDVPAGTGRMIVWDIDAALPGACIAEAQLRVVATVSTPPPSIDMAMVSVPAGSFEMGDPFNEGDADELPVHTVTLSAYSIGQFEVTNAQVALVYNWAIGQGLIDTVSASTVTHSGEELLDLDDEHSQLSLSGGELVVATRDGFSMAEHPVLEISWFGAVAFCNWLSALAGLPSVYDLSDFSRVNPEGGGYRLPTEAEWERASGWDAGEQRHWRYGTSSDSIDTSAANYARANPLGLTSDSRTTPVGFYTGVMSPVGCFDMSGNVWEWCEDWYSASYYATSPQQNPINSTVAALRVLRGGSWLFNASSCVPRSASTATRRSQTPTSGSVLPGRLRADLVPFTPLFFFL